MIETVERNELMNTRMMMVVGFANKSKGAGA